MSVELEQLCISASKYFKAKHGVDLRQDALASVRLRDMILRMVKDNERKVFLPFITATSDGPKHMEISFSGRDVRKVRKSLEAEA